VKRAIVQRRRELFATTLVTALLFATAFVNALGTSPASAVVPATKSWTVTAACNNTFNGTKFPLQYKIDSTPSADPVVQGASFTQTFHVTAVAAASFLNGVYAAVGITALPILPDQATITPLANATGPDVTTGLAATFTIPKPLVLPVTADVNIDLGTVTGTYTAGTAPGPATFTLKGSAFAPSRTLATGVTTNASTTITSSNLAFTAADLGHGISGAGIPGGTTIVSITNATTAVMSAAATATASNVSVTVAGDALPAGFTEPGWTQTGTTKALTASGMKTYETTNLAGGFIKASVICMGGLWTSTPSVPTVPRVVTDGHTTAASMTVTSATAAFTASDVGGSITGTGIPNFTTIASVTNATTAVLTKAAVPTASNVTFTITPPTTYGTPYVAPSLTPDPPDPTPNLIKTNFGAVDISAPGTTTTTAAPTTTSTAAPTTTSTAAPTTTSTAAPTTTTTAAPTTTTTAAPTTTTTAAPTTTTTAAPTTTTTAAPTTTTTAAPTTTTTAAPTTTTTAAPTTTTTAGGSTTTTTAAPTTTTTAAPTTTTTAPPVDVLGETTYNTDCRSTGNPTGPAGPINFAVTAKSKSPVQVGSDLVITDQNWVVTIPAALADELRTASGSASSVDGSVQVTVTGTNVAPGSITTDPIDITIDLSGAMGTAATGSFTAPDMTFVPSGGTATFTMSGTVLTSTNVQIGDPPASVDLVCVPTSGGNFLSIDVVAKPVTVQGTTTAQGTSSTTLPVTGTDSHALWIELLAALLMIQLGLLFITLSRKPKYDRGA
jgi:hypothetical protein